MESLDGYNRTLDTSTEHAVLSGVHRGEQFLESFTQKLFYWQFAQPFLCFRTRLQGHQEANDISEEQRTWTRFIPPHLHIRLSTLWLYIFTQRSDVPAGSPWRGGDVAVYVFDINQLSLSTPFYSVFVSISVSMALSTVFHSINSPYNSLLSQTVLPVLCLPHWSFQLYISF